MELSPTKSNNGVSTVTAQNDQSPTTTRSTHEFDLNTAEILVPKGKVDQIEVNPSSSLLTTATTSEDEKQTKPENNINDDVKTTKPING